MCIWLVINTLQYDAGYIQRQNIYTYIIQTHTHTHTHTLFIRSRDLIKNYCFLTGYHNCNPSRAQIVCTVLIIQTPVVPKQTSDQEFKRNVTSCNANIYFNQECLRKNVNPNYSKIKISHNFTSFHIYVAFIFFKKRDQVSIRQKKFNCEFYGHKLLCFVWTFETSNCSKEQRGWKVLKSYSTLVSFTPLLLQSFKRSFKVSLVCIKTT